MCLTARHHRQRCGMALRGEHGATLVLVLVGIVLMSVIAVSITAYSVTVSRVTASTIETQSVWRQLDGYLEKAVRDYRLDPNAVGNPCTGRWSNNPDWLPSQYSLTCESTSIGTADPSYGRLATIQLYSEAKLIGLAKVRVEDTQGTAPLTGSKLTVCAWQVGEIDLGQVAACG